MIFTGVKQAANEKAAAELAELPVIRIASNGYEVVAERMWSLHPGDHYLTIVLARSPKDQRAYGDEFVTWGFNKQDGGFFEGHYWPSFNAADAVKDFETRGRKPTK